MKKAKILYFIDDLSMGGIQKLALDWISKFNKDFITVDFLLLDEGKEYELETVLKNMGCNIYKLKNVWIRTPFDYINYAKEIDAFYKEHHDYDIVEMHSSSKNYMILKYAKKYNIKTRISHSHNIDFQTRNFLKKLVGNIFKKNLVKYSTDFIACSKDAGVWLFGNKIVNQDNFKIVYNSIDFDKFKYNFETRKKIREELNISDDEFLVGHIGRFIDQKNHEFLIDIFYEMYKLNSNAKLILLGTGPLQEKIKLKVNDLGIDSRVMFLGVKANANEYLQAMDVFVFPSLYEGLGIVLIEAQASGLKCFTSKDVVPIEAKIGDNFNYISLADSAGSWAKHIIDSSNDYNRDKVVIDRGNYDIEKTVKDLEEFYVSKVINNEKN